MRVNFLTKCLVLEISIRSIKIKKTSGRDKKKTNNKIETGQNIIEMLTLDKFFLKNGPKEEL